MAEAQSTQESTSADGEAPGGYAEERHDPIGTIAVAYVVPRP